MVSTKESDYRSERSVNFGITLPLVGLSLLVRARPACGEGIPPEGLSEEVRLINVIDLLRLPLLEE